MVELFPGLLLVLVALGVPLAGLVLGLVLVHSHRPPGT